MVASVPELSRLLAATMDACVSVQVICDNKFCDLKL
jgi:hypothetical protein